MPSRCVSRSGCTGELTLYPPQRKTFRLAPANIVQERVCRRNSIRHITSFYMRSKREKGIRQQQPSCSAFFSWPVGKRSQHGDHFLVSLFGLFIFHITEIITYFWSNCTRRGHLYSTLLCQTRELPGVALVNTSTRRIFMGKGNNLSYIEILKWLFKKLIQLCQKPSNGTEFRIVLSSCVLWGP